MEDIESKIENATLIEDSTTAETHSTNQINTHTFNSSNLEIHRLFYFLGIILMIVVYIGPFLYFKYYKKKNFIPSGNIGVKHAI